MLHFLYCLSVCVDVLHTSQQFSVMLGHFSKMLPYMHVNPFPANRSGIPVVHILLPICHNDGFLRLLVSHIPMVVKDM